MNPAWRSASRLAAGSARYSPGSREAPSGSKTYLHVRDPNVAGTGCGCRRWGVGPLLTVALPSPTPPYQTRTKEHVLVTALHSGVERSGTLAVFHLMEWLLSADPLARDILRKQLIVCMPVPNPDCYLQGEHGNVYSEWTLGRPTRSGLHPRGGRRAARDGRAPAGGGCRPARYGPELRQST